ncbi:complex I subunit 5 family protein [Mariniplasma anaerobium]|uniref:NADH dehydrogenase n=1 Tax=Mariniplasma anaerobium TaxID=2735436 RepID=A0A7U9TJ19_9MOLU|nr:proton-conducting transporter membrane subunit [Mariniplasma anaerobium]BCR35725.1 NADH dehydrogenase [Mariniplasma anaerobium]
MSAILLIAIPLLAAFLSIMLKKFAPYLLLGVGVFNVVLLFLIPEGFVILGGFNQPLGINLLLDTYSKIALMLVNAVVVVIAFVNIKEYSKFSSILLIAIAGLNGLILTNDLFNLYVFLEISAIAAYLISTSNKKPVKTFHYIIIGAVGSSLFLFGVVILYAMFGTLNMVDLIQKIQLTNNYSQLILPFLLMFIGLGVEVKLLPFNSWVKGVLGESNTLSGPMIASAYAAAFGFVLGRLITNLFLFEGSLLTVVTVILAVGIVMGDLMAFASNKAREILLYSSVAQAAIVAMLFVNGIVIWAVYLIVANALSKLVMFLVVNKAVKDVGSDEVNKLQGLFSKNVIVGLAFTLVTLSVMGLPLLVGFTLKLRYLTELASLNQIWLIAVILVASLIEGIYFVKLLLKLWYEGQEKVEVKYNVTFKVVFVIIAIALLTFGTYSTPLNNLDDSIDTITEVVNNG